MIQLRIARIMRSGVVCKGYFHVRVYTISGLPAAL